MENKKYSELSMDEFIISILKVELNECQKHMVKMFEEMKNSRGVLVQPTRVASSTLTPQSQNY